MHWHGILKVHYVYIYNKTQIVSYLAVQNSFVCCEIPKDLIWSWIGPYPILIINYFSITETDLFLLGLFSIPISITIITFLSFILLISITFIIAIIAFLFVFGKMLFWITLWIFLRACFSYYKIYELYGHVSPYEY